MVNALVLIFKSHKEAMQEITHSLKTVEPHFTDVWDGRKKMDIRFDDRGFKVGDFLHLLQYDDQNDKLSGKLIIAKVLHILKDEQFLQPNYCAMSLDIFNRF